MQDDLTAILIIMDRSGSMQPLADDTVGGFNNFIEQQKAEPGDAVVTLALFNHKYDIAFSARQLGHVEPLTRKVYSPHGGTALLDAIGRGIHELGRQLVAMEEKDRPGKVIVAVLTDGEENASFEYSREQIRKLIKERTEKDGWSFLFLGANIDAFAEARSLGVDPSNAFNWIADAAGVRHGLGFLSSSVSLFRSGMGTRTKH